MYPGHTPVLPYFYFNQLTSSQEILEMEIKSKVVTFGGTLIRFCHQSSQTRTSMTCAVFLPSTTSTSIPYLMYLSGLTCTDENVCQKSGVFRSLARNQVIICTIIFEMETDWTYFSMPTRLVLSPPTHHLVAQGSKAKTKAGILELELGSMLTLQRPSGRSITACIPTSQKSCQHSSQNTFLNSTGQGTAHSKMQHVLDCRQLSALSADHFLCVLW